MIKFVAIAYGTECVIVQRVRYSEPAHTKVAPIEHRQFEILAAPAVMKKYPAGKILGWFEMASSSVDIEIEPITVHAVVSERPQPRNRRSRPRFSDLERAVDRTEKKRKRSPDQTQGWIDVIKNTGREGQ